jgi:hypothetical protein
MRYFFPVLVFAVGFAHFAAGLTGLVGALSNPMPLIGAVALVAAGVVELAAGCFLASIARRS